MKLNVTKDHNGSETHQGPLFEKVEERQYAYQSETMSFSFSIHGLPPRADEGKLNRDLEKDAHDRYELVIERHTGKSLSLKLIAHRRDTLAQRIQNGFAVTEDVLIKSMDLAELVNRLFADGCVVVHTEENFPTSVKAAMKGAYK